MGQRFIRGALAPHPDDVLDGITYDCGGRMEYHPEFHFSHGEPWSSEDLEYLCTFYGVDSARTLSFALGKTEPVCRVKFYKLKSNGKVEFYRNCYKQKLEAN
ncbi:DNA-entry nuclease [Paenibacillus sp. FSL L8-0470]|uniref:DNA-entry nuclease n=1 Tax=Paenibacillus sp. FSL L8-0470 TaxID=2954688 RepID=UPI0030FC7E3E